MQANNVIEFNPAVASVVDLDQNTPKDKYFFVTAIKHPKFKYGEKVGIVRFESGTIIARNLNGVSGAIQEHEISDVWFGA